MFSFLARQRREKIARKMRGAGMSCPDSARGSRSLSGGRCDGGRGIELEDGRIVGPRRDWYAKTSLAELS